MVTLGQYNITIKYKILVLLTWSTQYSGHFGPVLRVTLIMKIHCICVMIMIRITIRGDTKLYRNTLFAPYLMFRKKVVINKTSDSK